MERCYLVLTGPIQSKYPRSVRGIYSTLEQTSNAVNLYLKQEQEKGFPFEYNILPDISELAVAIYTHEEYCLVVEVHYMNQPIESRA